MKQLMAITFCSFLLVSSCTCNEREDEDPDYTTIDTMDDRTANEGMMDRDGTSQPDNTAAGAGQDDYDNKMYNLNVYTAEQVREYRRLHDEMDWGNVPGFYPEASTRPLTEEDIRYLSDWGHKVMLNEIYARNGMRFEDPDLKAHFNRFDWYQPNTGNVDGRLSSIEKQNVQFLMNNEPPRYIP